MSHKKGYMSRRSFLKKRALTSPTLYSSLIINFLLNKILKKGKKFLAIKIVTDTLAFIKAKTQTNPLLILEKAFQNVAPKIKMETIKVKEGSSYQIALLLNKYRSLHTAIRWILAFSEKRSEKSFFLRLGSEILDSYQRIGNSFKKKIELYKYAAANQKTNILNGIYDE